MAPLKHEYNLKSRIDLLDYDYLDKLNPKEKEWLAKFTEEYTHANFSHSGTKIHKKKAHKTDSYNRNNARNRDIYTIQKSRHHLGNLDELKFEEEKIEIEDKLIEKLDLKKFKELTNKKPSEGEDDN